MKIELSDYQVDYAMKIAKQRHDAKHESFRNKTRYFNSNNSILSNRLKIKPEYMPHYVGVLGELGWAIMNNLEVNETIYSVRDPGEDFKGVEVKTITYFGNQEPELKITQKEYQSRKKPKLYVLTRVSIDRNEIEILGKITRENFDKLKVEKQYGEKLPKNYVVPLSLMEKV